MESEKPEVGKSLVLTWKEATEQQEIAAKMIAECRDCCLITAMLGYAFEDVEWENWPSVFDQIIAIENGWA